MAVLRTKAGSIVLSAVVEHIAVFQRNATASGGNSGGIAVGMVMPDNAVDQCGSRSTDVGNIYAAADITGFITDDVGTCKACVSVIIHTDTAARAGNIVADHGTVVHRKLSENRDTSAAFAGSAGIVSAGNITSGEGTVLSGVVALCRLLRRCNNGKISGTVNVVVVCVAFCSAVDERQIRIARNFNNAAAARHFYSVTVEVEGMLACGYGDRAACGNVRQKL